MGAAGLNDSRFTFVNFVRCRTSWLTVLLFVDLANELSTTTACPSRGRILAILVYGIEHQQESSILCTRTELVLCVGLAA